MIRQLLLLMLAFASMTVSAGEGESARVSLLVRPSLEPVQQAFVASGMKNVKAALVVTYDADGSPTNLEFDPASGNAALDRAIIDWGRQIRLTPGKAGIGRLPFNLIEDSNVDSSTSTNDGIPELNISDFVKKPTLQPVIEVMVDSNISKAVVQLLIEYDAAGKVPVASLARSTGSDALDKVLVEWAKGLRHKPGKAGKGRMPLDLQVRPGTAVDAAVIRPKR